MRKKIELGQEKVRMSQKKKKKRFGLVRSKTETDHFRFSPVTF